MQPPRSGLGGSRASRLMLGLTLPCRDENKLNLLLQAGLLGLELIEQVFESCNPVELGTRAELGRMKIAPHPG
ncbi:MAG: hypothetical protein QOH05_1451 [Acetobacteraceae bacterium]|jgi:hypothetical protein|nr:hypothetical protein [Acetobacteraceae bacterium]